MESSELRAVPGFDGYSITSDGRVWSERSKKWLKPATDGHGYRHFVLRAGGVTICRHVHRLVALAWVPNPRGVPNVNHLDGVKTNNAASNLEWCTTAENNAHAYRTGLAVGNLLPDEMKVELRRLHASGLGCTQLSLRTGIPRSTIRRAVGRG